MEPWFALTPLSPLIDSRVGAGGIELSTTLATFGGVTEPQREGSANASDPPPGVIVGGAALPPGSPAGPLADRERHSGLRLHLSAEGLGPRRQCMILAAVVACGLGDHAVQSLLGDVVLGEDPIEGEDRIALLIDVPANGRLSLTLWLRLISSHARSRLGIHGVEGHLL